jgi:hypothetical protein
VSVSLSLANMLSALLAAVVLGLLAWQLRVGRRREDLPEGEARRRASVAWEVRGLVIAVAGPLAAGIFFGYLSTDYTLPLLLFVGAGFQAAGLIAPVGRHARH